MPRRKIESEDSTPRRIQLLQERRHTLERPDGQLSLTYNQIAGIVRLGTPNFLRDVVIGKRYIFTPDPNNPNRYVVTSEDYQALLAIKSKIKHSK